MLKCAAVFLHSKWLRCAIIPSGIRRSPGFHCGVSMHTIVISAAPSRSHRRTSTRMVS